MKLTDEIDKASLKEDVPEFSPGDTVKVHVRVVEGNRERTQIFEGAVKVDKAEVSEKHSPCVKFLSGLVLKEHFQFIHQLLKR